MRRPRVTGDSTWTRSAAASAVDLHGRGYAPAAASPAGTTTAPDSEPAAEGPSRLQVECVARFEGGPAVAPPWDGEGPAGCDPVTEQAYRAVVAGMGWLGTPYAWGGGDLYGPTQGTEEGAALVGFDCSGLTRFAWASSGVLLPRNSRQQWNAPGDRITAMADLQPGDLVFFARDTADPSTIHHVGIALGNDAMLEAPEAYGHVHVVDDLSTNPGRAPMFIGGLRPRP